MSKFAFLFAVYLAATAVSGQLQELNSSTTTSPQTIAASHAAAAKCPSDEATGMAMMQAAKNAQIAVCASFSARSFELTECSVSLGLPRCSKVT